MISSLAYLPKYSTIIVDPPEELCDQGSTGIFNCAVLLSHRALSQRPLCLLNSVPQGVGPAVRPSSLPVGSLMFSFPKRS